MRPVLERVFLLFTNGICGVLLGGVPLGIVRDVLRCCGLEGGGSHGGGVLDLDFDLKRLRHGGCNFLALPHIALPSVGTVIVGGDVAPPQTGLLGCDVLDADAALVDGGALVTDVLDSSLEGVTLSLDNIVGRRFLPDVLAACSRHQPLIEGDMGDLAPLPVVVTFSP